MTAGKLGTSMARVLKSALRPRKNVNRASLFRNIVRKNFINLREARNARRLASIDRRFRKRKDVYIQVTCYLSQSIDLCEREWYHKQRRNFPNIVLAVFGMAAASSQDTEEGNSPPKSLVSQSLSHSPFVSPLHHGKRSANGCFTKAAKVTKKKLVQMRQGYKNYVAKRKLQFENCTDGNEPPPKRNTRSIQVSN